MVPVLLYLVAWNIGFGDETGLTVLNGLPTTIVRWAIVIFFTGVLVLFVLSKDAVFDSARWTLILSLVVLAPTVLLSSAPLYSLIEAVRYLSLAGVALYVSRSGSVDQLSNTIKWSAGILVYGSLVFGMLSGQIHLEDFANALGLDERIRFAGLTIHVNNFAYVGAIFVVITVLDIRKSSFLSGSNFVALVAGSSVVILSGSRSAFAVVALLLMVPLLGFKASPIRVSSTMLLGVFLVILAIQIGPLLKLYTSANVSLEGADSFQMSDLARVQMWRNSINNFLDNILFGAGFASQIEETYNALTQEYDFARYSHNVILNTAQATGLVGLSVLLVLNILIAKKLSLAFVVAKSALLKFGWASACEHATAPIILMSGVVVSAVDGGLQGNYGMTGYFAVAFGWLMHEHARR